MLERGAVEGEIFHRGAVQALAPDEPEVLPRLAALVRHELIRPDRPQFPGEDGFRFRHLLIRDAAYDALPKAVRADLHRRFADWLESKAGARRAGRARRLPPRAGRPLPGRAGPSPTTRSRSAPGIGSLAAGRRALDRERRARRGRAARARAHADAAASAPTSTPSSTSPRRSGTSRSEPPRSPRTRPCGPARPATRPARLSPARWPSSTASWSARGSPDELETLLLEARRRLEEAEDHAGLAYVWSALGYGVANGRGRSDDWAAAAEQAHHHSRLAGRSSPPPTDLGIALVVGSRPADEALETIDRLLAESAVAVAAGSAAPGCSPCSTAARRPGRTPRRRTRGSASRAATAGREW